MVYWAARRVQWANVNAVAFRWLAFVGRNSLPVFAWSILVAYAAEAALPVQSHVVFRIALLVVATMSLTVPAHLRAIYIGWRRSRSAQPALQTTLPETVGHGVLGTRS